MLPSSLGCDILVVCLGKTVTVVEAIKQIEKFQTCCHILACAPSNSAADLLCTKILEHVDRHKVYRMYATSRDPKLVPDHLKVSHGGFFNPCHCYGFRASVFGL